jgi:hypothetical protein
MLQFNAVVFYQATRLLARVRTLAHERKEHREKPVNSNPNNHKIAVDLLTDLIASLNTLGAKVTALGAKKLLDDLKKKRKKSDPDGDMTNAEFAERASELEKRLQDELSLVSLFVIESKKLPYFQPDGPVWGADFENKFPSAVFELEEACKSYALDRSTACVFHLMRTMEIAVRALARCLQIQDPTKPAERNWGAVLKAVRDGIDTKWPTTSARMAGDGNLFEELYSSLDAVKNPWRNATMHVEKKYTPDEAEHIFYAVGGFIKKISSRMDENGLPAA